MGFFFIGICICCTFDWLTFSCGQCACDMVHLCYIQTQRKFLAKKKRAHTKKKNKQNYWKENRRISKLAYVVCMFRKRPKRILHQCFAEHSQQTSSMFYVWDGNKKAHKKPTIIRQMFDFKTNLFLFSMSTSLCCFIDLIWCVTRSIYILTMLKQTKLIAFI